MPKINLLSKLTLLSYVYITVMSCFIGDKSRYITNSQPLSKNELQKEADIVLENPIKTEGSSLIYPKEIDSLTTESNLTNKTLPEKAMYKSLFADNGAAL